MKAAAKCSAEFWGYGKCPNPPATDADFCLQHLGLKNQKEWDDLVSMVGEGIHTTMRKGLESPESSTAWHAITALPDNEWTECLKQGLQFALLNLTASRKRR